MVLYDTNQVVNLRCLHKRNVIDEDKKFSKTGQAVYFACKFMMIEP